MIAPQQQLSAETMRRLVALGETPRYWRINALEALYEGHRYEGRPSFWDASVPLQERAPVVQAMLARVAVQRLTTLVFGERSFPGLTPRPAVWRTALSDADREALASLLGEIVATSHLSRTMRQYLGEGLKCGSACAVLSLVEGLPRIDLLPVKWCTPTLDRLGRVTRLVVEAKRPGDDGGWYWYRREIDDTSDRVWPEIRVQDREEKPRWERIKPVEEIALPFCPVVWTRNLPPATCASIDGLALCEGMEDELEALDFDLSQLHRNARYNGEPQMVRTGVDPERASPLGASGPGVQAPPDSRFSWLQSVLPQGWRSIGGGSQVAKKGPGQIWNLPAGGDAKLLESTGAGATILQGAVQELRRVVLDATGVVLADPQTLGSGDLSARALTLMHAPMLDVADNLRVDYGDALCEILSGVVRLCLQAGGDGVLLASWDKARAVVARLIVGDRWLGLPLALQWGPYFEPSAADVRETIASARSAAGDRPVVSARTAVQMAARVTGVTDVDAECEALEGEESVVRGVLAAASKPEAEEPAEVPEAAPVAGAEKIADTAMNGAQVAALLDTVERVARGAITREMGLAIITTAFPVSEEQAQRIVGRPEVAGTLAPPAAPATPATPPVTEVADG